MQVSSRNAQSQGGLAHDRDYNEAGLPAGREAVGWCWVVFGVIWAGFPPSFLSRCVGIARVGDVVCARWATEEGEISGLISRLP